MVANRLSSIISIATIGMTSVLPLQVGKSEWMRRGAEQRFAAGFGSKNLLLLRAALKTASSRSNAPSNGTWSAAHLCRNAFDSSAAKTPTIPELMYSASVELSRELCECKT